MRIEPSGDGGASLPELTDIEQAGATRLTVPGGLDWIALAGGSAWAANESLTRLDGRTGAVLSTLPLPGPTCLAPDVGFGALWLPICGTPQVLRIDLTTGEVVAAITVQVSDLLAESSLAAGAGGVWVLSSQNQLVQIDPATNEVAQIVLAPKGASAVRTTTDALWVTVHRDGTLLRLELQTFTTVATIAVGSGPQFLAATEDAVWTLDQAGGSVTRVDPATNTAVTTIEVDHGSVVGGDIAVGGGFVWARVSDGLVTKIDPRTNAVVARYGPPRGSGSVAADATAAWVTAHDSNSIYRLPLP